MGQMGSHRPSVALTPLPTTMEGRGGGKTSSGSLQVVEDGFPAMLAADQERAAQALSATRACQSPERAWA